MGVPNALKLDGVTATIRWTRARIVVSHLLVAAEVRDRRRAVNSTLFYGFP